MLSLQSLFLARIPSTCRRRAYSDVIGPGTSSSPLKRRCSGISAKMSSTLEMPIFFSISALTSGTELGM